jgi:hypothetical protein
MVTLLASAVRLYLAATLIVVSASAGLLFNFDFATGTPQSVIDGFTAAGARWSSLFIDDVTINISAGLAALDPGVLGQTSTLAGYYSYDEVRTALAGDITSQTDLTAVQHLLQAGPLSMLINRTADNPNGSGSATPYLDNDGSANNTTLRMTTANARALGLLSGTSSLSDASIWFSSADTFDFDPGNGIDAGAYDFVGLATHEIAHAMGFISGVDALDTYSQPGWGGPYSADQLPFVSTLDLFRVSEDSIAQGAIDWTADNRQKWFSIDGGGYTPGVLFANGAAFGDGYQASHWKNNHGIGIMDPTIAPGELLEIGRYDVQALDAIGFDPVPEPSSLSLMAAVIAALLLLERRRLKTRP